MTSIATTRGSDYACLSRQVKQAGLLRRRPGYYTAKVVLTLGPFVAGWAGFVLLGRTWYQLLVAAFLGVAFTQVAFLGHDAGHRQIFATRHANDLLGLLNGNLLVGLSFGWWIDKHNRHHAHPNTEGADPDIGEGVFAFTSAQAGRRTSAVGRLMARKQAWLFFPMLLLEGLNLHVAGVRALLDKSRRHRARPVEAALLLVHGGAYLTAVFLVLTPMQGIAFIAVQQGLFGLYMGASFAPNHKGMPILSADDQIDYLRRQVLTSRNVRGGRFTDYVLGGLNYQIEHHLFPSMPRPNLRRAQAIIRAYCHEQGISYREDSLLASYAQTLSHLADVGSAAHSPARS
ncbi:MAG: delta fatty acid desaturase [Pseudonocardiales bacterium]|nr:MAG: delta fatty acid desaturase [Pseudonocardiales bacterium]